MSLFNLTFAAKNRSCQISYVILFWHVVSFYLYVSCLIIDGIVSYCSDFTDPAKYPYDVDKDYLQILSKEERIKVLSNIFMVEMFC